MWRTDTWASEQTVTEYFSKVPSCSIMALVSNYAQNNAAAMFSRLSWSTDGLSVITGAKGCANCQLLITFYQLKARTTACQSPHAWTATRSRATLTCLGTSLPSLPPSVAD